MAWLPLYLLEKDIEFLNDWLDQEEEIAFLISQGHKHWKAEKQRDILKDIGQQKIYEEGQAFSVFYRAEYALWHTPSGSLPMLTRNSANKLRFKKEDWSDPVIKDPWIGWEEEITGANPIVPYFGAGHPGIIHLDITLHEKEEIPISNFSWIGNHYKIIGSTADKSTEKFWSKLRRMAKKVATPVPRANAQGKPEIYAFPQAYEAIKAGRPCALNP